MNLAHLTFFFNFEVDEGDLLDIAANNLTEDIREPSGLWSDFNRDWNRYQHLIGNKYLWLFRDRQEFLGSEPDPADYPID